MITRAIFALIVICFTTIKSFGQFSRVWDFNYSPPLNLEAEGYGITCMPSGNVIVSGIYKSAASSYTRNALLLVDDN